MSMIKFYILYLIIHPISFTLSKFVELKHIRCNAMIFAIEKGVIYAYKTQYPQTFSI